MAVIRLQLTDQLKTILLELKETKFPLLENAEIIKAGLSDYYTQIREKSLSLQKERWESTLPSFSASDKEEKMVANAKKSKTVAKISSPSEISTVLHSFSPHVPA